MSHKQDKAAKRKAKLKARKFHAEQHRLYQSGRIADALMDLCADVLPEYVDDSRGIDLVGRNILWRMGMVAWNIAVTGRREIDESSINTMKLDEENPGGWCGMKSTRLSGSNTRNILISGPPFQMYPLSMPPELQS
ncbi:hypothetical protein [Victivallis vadensis]|uniref:hypothetical protein n=1 Tax=Victivallis vadensis TaxID=172901 RepID=UPI003AF8E782